VNPVAFGVVAGLVFGAIDVAVMIPMDFSDRGDATAKRRAMLGAFLSRFAIGFLIPVVGLRLPHFIVGAIVGLLISLPDAVITKAYAPIIGSGVVGGLLIGWAAGRYAS
jgi:hypothetical protein